jgi:hypothetical protein
MCQMAVPRTPLFEGGPGSLRQPVHVDDASGGSEVEGAGHAEGQRDAFRLLALGRLRQCRRLGRGEIDTLALRGREPAAVGPASDDHGNADAIELTGILSA